MRFLVAIGALAALGLAGCATDPYGYYGGAGYGGGYGGGYGSPNASLDATYGNVYLQAGFDEDPYTIDLAAGGTVNAASAASGCEGIVAVAPDVQLTYDAGGYNLTIRTSAGVDTTLLINGPDGRWYCDDDSGGGTDAAFTFYNPQTGVYDIWVGVYSGANAPAQVLITELE